jgi:hypothetical protein
MGKSSAQLPVGSSEWEKARQAEAEAQAQAQGIATGKIIAAERDFLDAGVPAGKPAPSKPPFKT